MKQLHYPINLQANLHREEGHKKIGVRGVCGIVCQTRPLTGVGCITLGQGGRDEAADDEDARRASKFALAVHGKEPTLFIKPSIEVT